jgi:hypothetical protein
MMTMGGLDVVGDDDVEGSMVLGAPRSAIRVPTPRWMRGATSQGVSRPHEELDYLPFSSLELNDTVTGGSLLSLPQRPMRGERLIMAAFGTVGGTTGSFAEAVGIDPAIYVGAVQIGATQGTTPVSVFAATAFGVRLSMPAAGQGTTIRIFVRSLITLAAGDSIVVTATLIGRAVR